MLAFASISDDVSMMMYYYFFLQNIR